MKPTINTLECGNKEIEISQTKVERKKTSKRKKVCCGVILVTSFVIVCAVFVAGIYFGVLTSKHYKSYWATIHLGHGREALNEQLIFTATEEDIIVPGKLRVIYDYERGLFAIRINEEEVCFVGQYNATAMSTLSQAKEFCQEHAKNNHINGTVTDKPDEVDVRVTDFEANLDILSERTKEMCSDVKVFWMEIRKGNTPVGERREKRSWRLIDKDFENQFIRPSNNKWSYQIIYAK